MNFQRQTLSNGLQIVAEVNPHALSTAVGFFVRTGARDEQDEVAGVSHFLEHMAFKGSEKRGADDVNREFDEIGAKYNAYTTEEHTVFHAAVLPEYLPRAIDLLADLLRPSLRSDDFEMEKKVILEEIGMYADSPMWTAYERAMRLHFDHHPIGNSVLGSVESVSGLTAEQMRSYHQARYAPGNIFVAAAGKLGWDELVSLVSDQCDAWPAADCHRQVTREHGWRPGELVRRDEFAQENFCLMTVAPAADNEHRIAAEVLANIIGDDTGSRFYWALVEPGKVDSLDFSYHEYEGAGAFMITMSCEPQRAEANLEEIHAVIDDVLNKGISEEELVQAKNKLSARVVLASERPMNRLFALGSNWSYRQDYHPVERDLDDLASITLGDLKDLINAYPLREWTTVALGPLPRVRRLDGVR